MSLTTATSPSPTTTAGSTVMLDRLGGAGGLAFAALIVFQNVLRAKAPSFGATPAKVVAYFLHHRTPVLIPLGLFPVEMVALFVFVAAIWTRAEHDDSRWWTHVGVLGATAIAGLFAIVNITEIALAASTQPLASAAPVVQALWAIHAAAFGLDMAAIALALLGLSQAAAASHLISRPIQLAAMPGVLCLLISATFTVGLADGGPWIIPGLVGFVIWIVFVLGASVSLLRGLAPVGDDR
jgi:hypothetical protein